MAPADRPKFTKAIDWHNFLSDIQENNGETDLYALRQTCYEDIEKLRGRPLLVYAVEFPLDVSNGFAASLTSIDLADVDGFTDLIDAVPTDRAEIDILIHSPGGSPEATERIVDLLRSRFKVVNFLVPHSAYSAATMLALSGNEIILNIEASLGPIDPQINGVPARALKRGFETVKSAIQEEGPEALPAYIPLIEKYTLELLEICEDYEFLSRALATEWLTAYMFKGEKDADKTISDAVSFFSDYDTHRTHSRPLTYNKLQSLGLNIHRAEPDLQQLLREAHVLLSGFLNISPFVKIYENSKGLSWGKQFQMTPSPDTPPN